MSAEAVGVKETTAVAIASINSAFIAFSIESNVAQFVKKMGKQFSFPHVRKQSAMDVLS